MKKRRELLWRQITVLFFLRAHEIFICTSFKKSQIMTSGTCKSRSKLVPIIDSSDSDMEPSYSEVINGRNESSTHTGMVSSSSSGRSRMSETRKQSGSRRKRRRISSDSSDKENSNTI